jgi:DNA-directed RNA polymerase subunit RPC12/RpoP
MIDSLLNLMFRCSHRRLTRPVSPVSKAGVPHQDAYVVCLDCGKQFFYDLKAMKIGKVRELSHDSGVLPPDLPKPRGKMRYAVLASLPLGVLIGAALGSRRKREKPPEPPDKTGQS